MPEPTTSDLLTVQEVADRLRISKMTTYRLIHSGALPSLRVSSRGYRIRQADLDAYMDGGAVEALQ